MAEKKSFFIERIINEIRSLHNQKAYFQRDLVRIIDELDPTADALEIRTQIIPGKFAFGNAGAEASKKCYKHGSLIPLPQLSTLEDTYNCHLTPLDLRTQAFSELQKRKQQDINYVGYSWKPVFGNRTKRIVPFVNVVEGVRLFSYAENYSKFRKKNPDTGIIEERLGIKVEAYPDAGRVVKEGANVIVEIPSRTVKRPKYKFGLLHVPFIPNNPKDKKNYNLAIILGLQPTLLREEETEELIVGITEHQIYDIQYKFEKSREHSHVIRFSPQDITGYLGIIKKQLTEDHNATALNFNPFALPSRHQSGFYIKLCNNVMIYDPSLSTKHKLRKLHLAEKSILISRAIANFGPEDFAYWDPVRDGIFKNYSWSYLMP